jgi:hypothetical protein
VQSPENVGNFCEANKDVIHRNNARLLFSSTYRTGRLLANATDMKRNIVLVMLLLVSSCARRVQGRSPAPDIIRADHYLYTKGDDGRVYIVTTNTKDFDQAMKELRPGPASVDKLDLWVVTPAPPAKKGAH